MLICKVLHQHLILKLYILCSCPNSLKSFSKCPEKISLHFTGHTKLHNSICFLLFLLINFLKLNKLVSIWKSKFLEHLTIFFMFQTWTLSIFKVNKKKLFISISLVSIFFYFLLYKIEFLRWNKFWREKKKQIWSSPLYNKPLHPLFFSYSWDCEIAKSFTILFCIFQCEGLFSVSHSSLKRSTWKFFYSIFLSLFSFPA